MLLLLEYLWVEMRQSMGVGPSTLGHASHHGSRIDLSAGTRSGHVSGHLGWYSWLCPWLTWVVSHAGSTHGMAGVNTGVLLHSWVETRSHACHHVLYVDYPHRGYRRSTLSGVSCAERSLVSKGCGICEWRDNTCASGLRRSMQMQNGEVKTETETERERTTRCNKSCAERGAPSCVERGEVGMCDSSRRQGAVDRGCETTRYVRGSEITISGEKRRSDLTWCSVALPVWSTRN